MEAIVLQDIEEVMVYIWKFQLDLPLHLLQLPFLKLHLDVGMLGQMIS